MIQAECQKCEDRGDVHGIDCIVKKLILDRDFKGRSPIRVSRKAALEDAVIAINTYIDKRERRDSMSKVDPKPESQLIYRKMIEIMRDIGAVSKDQKNTQQNFKFRGIDQFVNALYPVLCRHGVFMTPRCVNETHELREVMRSSGKAGIDKHVHIQMEYAFFADDGSSVVVGPIVGEGLDSGDKATAKALSASLKYALIQTFCTPTEDMTDGDSESPEIIPQSPQVDKKPIEQKPFEFKISQDQIARMFAIAKDKGINNKDDLKQWVCKTFQIESVSFTALTKQQYDDICKELGSAAVTPSKVEQPWDKYLVK